MPPTPLDLSSWPSLTASLAEQLGALADGEFVTLSAPADGPFVQALSLGPGLYLECVGSQTFGGTYPWQATQEEALAALGWAQETQFGHAVYRVDLPSHSTVAAAEKLVASLRDVGGVTSPADLVVSTG